MLKTELKSGEKEVVSPIAGPSVFFSTSGKGKMSASGEDFEIREGYIFFVGQGVEVAFEAEKEEGLVVYRAYAE